MEGNNILNNVKRRSKKRVFLDTVIVVIIAVFSFIFAYRFHLHRKLDMWTERFSYSLMRLDEFLFMSLVLVICMAIFAFRRWIDMRAEVKERESAEKELKKYRSRLEELVQARAAEVMELNKKIEFILGATKTGLDIIDSNYNMIYIDPEWAKAYGDSPGKKCYEYFMGRKDVCPGCGVKLAFETKRPVITEEMLVKEGNRPIQVTTIPYQDNKGDWFVAEVNVDISERKKTEEELKKYREHLEDLVRERTEAIKESELRFRTLFDDSTDGIVLADIETRRFLMANKALCGMLGYSEEEMRRLKVDDIHPEGDLPHVLEQFNKQKKGISKIAPGLPIKRKDGSIFYADITASAVTLNGKKYLVGSFRDTTEHREAEEALKKSEESYRAIFESASDAIFIRDIKTYEIVDANNKACEMLCRSREEMIGSDLSSIIADSDKYDLKSLSKFFEKASDGQPQFFEWIIKDKFGRQFWIETNVKRAVIGGEYRLLSITRDITERKQLLEQKDNFMNTVSHELRTPLSAIKESINIVIDGLVGAIDQEKMECLAVAKRNVDRLSRLIDNVLDFQKLDAGKMEFKITNNDLNDTVKEVERAMISLAAKKGLRIVVKTEGKLPKIKFDKDRITQVLTNIVNNSIKFTHEGTITIVTAVKDDYVRVSIEDTGVGVREDNLPRLFKKFEQLGHPSGVKSSGTGLGLAICKEIIDRHNGKIWAESGHGKGLTIYFTLPVKR